MLASDVTAPVSPSQITCSSLRAGHPRDWEFYVPCGFPTAWRPSGLAEYSPACVLRPLFHLLPPRQMHERFSLVTIEKPLLPLLHFATRCGHGLSIPTDNPLYGKSPRAWN